MNAGVLQDPNGLGERFDPIDKVGGGVMAYEGYLILVLTPNPLGGTPARPLGGGCSNPLQLQGEVLHLKRLDRQSGNAGHPPTDSDELSTNVQRRARSTRAGARGTELERRFV